MTLRWLQPGPPASYWQLYRDLELIRDQIIATPDSEGVRSLELDPWPRPAGYTMIAVNSEGSSPRSNEIVLPEASSALGLSVLVVALLVWRGLR